MSNLDWIGPPRDPEMKYFCGFAPRLGDLHCNRDVTWHGIKFDENGDIIAVSSCDLHQDVITDICEYVHPHVHPCGIDGAIFRWPENECFIDWDENAEFPPVAMPVPQAVTS